MLIELNLDIISTNLESLLDIYISCELFRSNMIPQNSSPPLPKKYTISFLKTIFSVSWISKPLFREKHTIDTDSNRRFQILIFLTALSGKDFFPVITP